MIIPDLTITDADREKYRNYEESAIVGIKLVEAQTTEFLRDVVEREGTNFDTLNAAIGERTNRNWTLARCCDALYDRGEMGQKEYDYRIDE